MRLAASILFAVGVVVLALLIDRVPFTTPTPSASRPSAVGYEGGTLQPGGEVDGYSSPEARRLLSRGPRGPYIVIDKYSNRLLLRTSKAVLLEAICSTGSGGELVDSLTGRRWRFDTPIGVFTVHTKLKNPWWRKPDWAFVEDGLPVPTNEAERLDDEMMGDYAIGFSDGYFIHGTIYERLLGKAVTHGCVRLAAEDLKMLYDNVQIGTLIYVY
ncbi:MAG: L,D-transpeptidase family protein [candidate division Zixibacteria bacterium]|nr:L,D-transpeptidase family protein [candidate division Zixibacteria bacterium]